MRYRSWLIGATDHDVDPERRAWILAHLDALRGQVLECHCKPLTCHGDVLVEFVEER